MLITKPTNSTILVTGSSGLIGRAITESLSKEGNTVLRLVRQPAPKGPQTVYWKNQNELSLAEDTPLDTVIHLAGEPILGIWTAAKKARIADSRVAGTALFCSALAHRARKPKVIVCASAIGFYGSRGDEVLTEDSPAGMGFLAQTCFAWEAAAQPALDAGIRVVHVRIGIVLSRKGGMLASMLLPFKLGLGSCLGSGKQWMSWIALEDLVRVFEYLIANDTCSGPFNAVSPNPTTNTEFTKALAKVLHRPMFLPIPELVLKFAPGGMGDEIFLSSQRVLPQRLMQCGFQFEFTELENTLKVVS